MTNNKIEDNQKFYIAYKLEFGILLGNSEHMATTHSLMESIKNFRSKTFCVGCLRKEYFPPFLFTTCMLKQGRRKRGGGGGWGGA